MPKHNATQDSHNGAPTSLGFRWSRLPLLAFAWVAYLLFARSTLYLIGFVGNVYVPRQIDQAGPWSQLSIAANLGINTILVLAFAAHHSLFARTPIKRWVQRLSMPLLERSFYVLVSSLLLILLMWQWRALPQVVWHLEAPALRATLWGIFGLGWILALASSFRLGHSETFGTRPILRHCQQREFEQRPVERRAMYKIIRHPMYAGFLIGVWATPSMSLGHLQLALLLTVYILIGRHWEERDLIKRYGDDYRRYQAEVPPLLPARSASKIFNSSDQQ